MPVRQIFFLLLALWILALPACDDGKSSTEADGSDVTTQSDTRIRQDTVSGDLGDDVGVDATLDLTMPDDTESDLALDIVPTAQDLDGDGLDDAWEDSWGRSELLDSSRADTDGDGVLDGDEDPDGDGIETSREFWAAEYDSVPNGALPNPLRQSVFIELDAMAGAAMPNASLQIAVDAYAAMNVSNVDGSLGIDLQIYVDELNIPSLAFDGSFDQRHQFMRDHGPKFATLSEHALPLSRMVHMVAASRRTDLPDRGGEVVTHGNGDVEATGVFVYHDSLNDLHPQCGVSSPPVVPAITLEEALAGTFTHELGHALQLGHDTDVNGGINHFNVMSIPTSCTEARQRFHGEGNSDASLGATEAVGASRFSDAAAGLLMIRAKLSVEVSDLADDNDGFEM
ncbi:MAG: hypothetical protein AUK47_13660 [Deltaproteobacteria bacterium CG2_30_63_29]|nr:MAG: hypothetical protein AUK47_13660 [Deltaproteobacteria bacterium CG2_30_63_29]PJB48341.1 MAG: hypothetical protein CO108_02500 [Deltaproteobacteria bacterium CG_4_9_14_3_um_filter_63_12]